MRRSSWLCFAVRVRKPEPAGLRTIYRASAVSLQNIGAAKVRRFMAPKPEPGSAIGNPMKPGTWLRACRRLFRRSRSCPLQTARFRRACRTASHALVELTRDEHGVALAFEGQDGRALATAFDDLLGAKSQSGLLVGLGDYPEVFQTALPIGWCGGRRRPTLR